MTILLLILGGWVLLSASALAGYVLCSCLTARTREAEQVEAYRRGYTAAKAMYTAMHEPDAVRWN